jgi:hypothetical protein
MRRREAGEGMLARFESADDVIQTRQVGHNFVSMNPTVS